MNKVALITGGSRGIGYGIAQALAREGWHLAISGLRTKDQVAPALEALGCSFSYYQGDVGELSSHEPMIQNVLREHGALHLLVNNAGVAPKVRADLLDMSEESYEYVMGINLRGTFFLTQRVAKHFVEQRERDREYPAAIVTISSISATVASINRGEYCLSKAGLSMATQLFATRLGPHGIPVYELRPGITRTDMTAGVREKYDKLLQEGLCPQARWGEPDDVGRAVAALARGDFPYSTGQVIMVDGGLTIPRL